MKPYYDDGTVTIYNADIRDDITLDTKAAAAITSPPYNVGIDYADHSDVMPWIAYRSMAESACIVTAANLIEGGRTWVNVTPSVPIVPLPPGDHSGRCTNARISLLSLWLDALELAGLAPWDVVCWPTPGRGGGTAWGSWQSPAGPNLRGEWEAILVNYKGTWGRPTPAEHKGWQDKLGGWQTLVSNVWKMQPVARGPEDHPAPYPITLADRAIRLSTWPGETVFDPFMGSGTTLVAAKALGRKAVGVELSEAYCEIAANRLAQEVLFV